MDNGDNFNVLFHENINFGKFLRENSGGLIRSDLISSKTFREMVLSNSAQRMRNVPNAGGNSVISEVLSFEFLNKACQAELLQLEMEVSYSQNNCKKIDFVCKIFDINVGVSVTRAIKFNGQFKENDAKSLLIKKLNGIIQSRKYTTENWSKQILHVWVQTIDHAYMITNVYNELPDNIRANTIVLVTTSSCSSIYENE